MAKLFDIFSGTKNRKDKGVQKEDIIIDSKFSTKSFFKLLKNKFGKITLINVLFVLCNFPLIIGLFGFSGNLSDKEDIPSSQLYPQIYGISQYSQNLITDTYNSVYGINTVTYVDNSVSMGFKHFAFLAIFTFGISNVGMIYLLRNIVKGEQIFVWYDFWYAVKRNLKQAVAVGILDLFIVFLLFFDIYAYNANGGNTVFLALFYLVIILAILYIIMRFYIYTLMVTFKLSILKIIKNSFLLSILGFKRHFMAMVGIIAVLLINLYLWFLIPSIGIIIPFIWTISLCSYIGIYCTFPIVKRIMIDPYYAEHKDEKYEGDDSSDIKPIFTDRG